MGVNKVSVADKLLEGNEKWRKGALEAKSNFFEESSQVHQPSVFWVGCSDARVPAEMIVNQALGEMFVHRNIANQAHMSDLNFASALEFAVSHLKVQALVICGHYGCAGVACALDNEDRGKVSLWTKPIKTLCHDHKEHLDKLDSFDEKHNQLVELNILEQVKTLSQCPTVKSFIPHLGSLEVIGLVYDLHSGEVRHMGSEKILAASC